jgi:hypothetical protein
MAAIETSCAGKPATITFYRSKLDQILKYKPLASRKLDMIDKEAVDLHKQMRKKAKSNRSKLFAVASVNRELAALRRLLRLAHESTLIGSVPKGDSACGHLVVRPAHSKNSKPRNCTADRARGQEKMPAEFVPYSLRHTSGARLGEAGAYVHYNKAHGPQ